MAVPNHHLRLSGLADVLRTCYSLYGILTFLFVGGIAGFVSNWPLPYIHPVARLLLAAAVGFAGSLVCSASLGPLLRDDSGHLTPENSALAGKRALVTRVIRPDGVGEVICAPNGGAFQNISARSVDNELIHVNRRVVIIDIKEGIALVEPRDYFDDEAAIQR